MRVARLRSAMCLSASSKQRGKVIMFPTLSAVGETCHITGLVILTKD
jgi:hypothetical protein